MAAHYAISIDLKPFVLLTIPNAFQKNIPVFDPNKNIQPLNDGKRHEIDRLLIADFKLPTHKISANGDVKIIKSEDL
jgi:hypothetical protein